MDVLLGKPKYHSQQKKIPNKKRPYLAESMMFAGLPKHIATNLKKSKDFLPVLLEHLDEKYKR